jgi:mRNA interferase YafQ
MKEVFQTSHFKRDVKRLLKRGKNFDKLKDVVGSIADGLKLDARYKDHALGGDWVGSRDCHIEPDWVLIYRVEEDLVYLERTGSHSDLFK